MDENRPSQIHDPGGLSDPTTHHEEYDVNVWALTRFGIAGVFVIIICLMALWGLFNIFNAREAAEQGPKPPSAGVDVDARKLPPEPRLQSTPILDMREMHAAEDAIMNGYAWVDPDKGIVRIPLGHAIDIMAKRGFPVRPNAGIPQPGGPTESGTGPAIQQPGGPLAGAPPVEPTQPEQIKGMGEPRAGRQAGGPPTQKQPQQ